jgi:hypothetical protein
MDAPDVRGMNNTAIGKEQCTYSETTHRGIAEALPDGFHGALDAVNAPKKENARHRAMLFMFARGDTDVMVAEQTGYSLVQIANIRRAPWMQEQIQAEIRKAGEKDVRDLLNEMGPNCLKGIYELAQNPEAKEEVKLRARQDIVDRWIGKACQPTKDETKGNLDELADADLIKIAKGEK